MKRIGQRFEIEGSVRRKSGSGRPRASTVKDDHRLKMTVLKDRKKTYVDHSKEFKTAAGNSLSRMTISRRLNEVGFNSKRCAKKPLFPAIKILKLAWPIFFVHECMYSQRLSPYVVSYFCRHGTSNVGVHCSNEIPVSTGLCGRVDGYAHFDPSLPLSVISEQVHLYGDWSW